MWYLIDCEDPLASCLKWRLFATCLKPREKCFYENWKIYFTGNAVVLSESWWFVSQVLCNGRGPPRCTGRICPPHQTYSFSGRTQRKEWNNGNWRTLVTILRWTETKRRSSSSDQDSHPDYKGIDWHRSKQLYAVVGFILPLFYG